MNDSDLGFRSPFLVENMPEQAVYYPEKVLPRFHTSMFYLSPENCNYEVVFLFRYSRLMRNRFDSRSDITESFILTRIPGEFSLSKRLVKGVTLTWILSVSRRSVKT